MAKKNEYRLNPHSLTYEKVKLGFKGHFKRFSYHASLSILVGFLLTLGAYHFIDSPKEKKMRREITQYQRQLTSINSQMGNIVKVLEDMENRDDNIYRVIFGVEPVNVALRHSGSGGTERYADLKGYNNSEEIISTTKRLDSLSQRIYIQSKSLDDVLEIAKDKYNRLSSMPAIMPVSLKKGNIVSGFGMRFHPILKYRREHTGIDISAPSGTEIYATGDGVVVSSGRNDAGYSGYGIYCVIDHGYGYKTLYGHMSTVSVVPGQKIKRGAVIGKVGSTGLSQSPHLHYEVILNDKKVDPVYYFFNDLSPEEYERVISEASIENQCLS